MNLDKDIIDAQVEFDLRLTYVRDNLTALLNEYQRKRSPAAVVEQVENLADTALSALRACDYCRALEDLRDSP